MLQIRLLGQFDVRLDGKRVTIPSRSGQSLLAYLVLTAGTPHRREKLAGVFWPDTTDESARKNLRQELWRIRKAISAQQSTGGDYLIADEFTLKFNRDAKYWLDVAQMERPDRELQSLIANLSLYQGELLPGFYDEWIMLERERIQSVFDTRMEQMLEQLTSEERWIAAQDWGERWLTLSGLREPAYRTLMLASGARGDMAKVAYLYQRCTEELMEQLGVEPSPETRALYDGLLKGTKAPRASAQPSGTITFLFTDIEGSTRLLESLGDQYAALLSEHHEILRDTVQKWNGREVDTQGDAFFITFTRARDAVQCAAEAQRALAFHSWPHGEAVRVRMGLHTGEPLIASTGYIGMDVHRAARIGDVGHGGQILLSKTTRELVAQDLPEELTIRDLGEHRLKDMIFPTPIYQLVVKGLPADFAPLRTKFTGAEAPTPGEPPFKGLQFFDVADANLFFGREALTAKIIQRLQGSNFMLVIIGASGSGKSSLIRAGIVPAIKDGGLLVRSNSSLEGNRNWRIHIMTPTAHPLEALGLELTHNSESVTAAATLIDDFFQDPRSLYLFLSRKAPKRDSSHTLLVIDQFEELFTLCRDNFEREAFIDNLLTAITQSSLPMGGNRKNEGSINIIITLRADFYAHLAQYPELRDAVAQHQEYIGPMTSEELRRAIEEPALRGHWEFEPGLVDLILRDVGDEPGALPLLSHALLETWKRRARHVLTLKGYSAAGGVHGAIAHTAESLFQRLSPSEQTIMRNILLRLTQFGDGTEDTRRRASFNELMLSAEKADDVRAVLNQLAEARLVILSEDTAEVAHEALIREWPQLREWLTQDREGNILHRHLTEAALEWELLEQDVGSLYRGARLAQANEWSALNPKALNAQERLFLEASNNQVRLEEQEREHQRARELTSARELAETQRQSASRLRTRNRVITTVGTLAIILAIVAGLFGFKSNQNAIASQANLTHAESLRLAAEANALLKSGGSSELIALLSLASINLQYSPQGDAALLGAANLIYPLQNFIGHTGWVMSVAFSPDGKYILSGSLDKTVRLWDAQTGIELRQFVHPDVVQTISFSPDGKYILTAGLDEVARLWDVQTGVELRQFVHPKPLGSTTIMAPVSFSLDGKRIFTGGLDKTVREWDAQTGRELQQWVLGDSISFISKDGRYALTISQTGYTMRLWDIRAAASLQTFTNPQAGWGTFISPNEKYVFTGDTNGKAHLWNLTSGQEVQTFEGHTGGVSGVAFSPDGKYMLTGSGDKTARLWDIQTGQEIQQFVGHTHIIHALAFSPDGQYVLTGSHDGTVRLWEVQPDQELPVFVGHNSGIAAIAFSPNGKNLATADYDDTIRLWDVETGQTLRTITGNGPMNYGLAFSPDGKYIFTGNLAGNAKIWDIDTGQVVRQFATNGLDPINAVAYSPDGRYVLTGGATHNSQVTVTRMWEAATGKESLRFSIPIDTADVYGVDFSPDGKYVLTVHIDHLARLWDAQTGEEIREFAGHTDSLVGGAFSPDGRYIVTASTDRTAILWDTQSGKELRRFIGHTDLLWGVAYSPNGKYIATASADGTVRLWDVQTGQELRRYIGHKAAVENVTFSPDSRYLASVSDDGTARLWDVDYHTTVQYLCTRLRRDFTEAERTQYNIMDITPTCPEP